MKNLVILGAGTAGTMMANHLIKKLPKQEWTITIIDQHKTHYYQPGFLFLPFDIYTEDQVKKTGKNFIPKGVNYLQKKIDLIKPEANVVVLQNEESISYDILIIFSSRISASKWATDPALDVGTFVASPITKTFS
jgi:sulfide:quinone oxidoreductase